ncbi:hypothetical protein SBRCBS47491_009747 [Sporothrix bragantina]|uniref:Uncharacterized protein n=1 Tax=Sporothrix bragantina TaxID=671064 RepID=A0ABP0CX95_9PEZI
MTPTTTSREPFDHSRLLALLASEGAGEEELQKALHERASDGTAHAQGIELLERELANDVVLQLFLPFKTISEAAGEVPTENDDDGDSDDGSFGGYSPSSLDGHNAGSPSHQMFLNNTLAQTHDSPVQTYIFPPSPLTALGQPESDSDDNPHAETAVEAAHYLHLVDPDAGALLQSTVHDLQTNTVILSREWSSAFSRFEAIIEPCDPSISDGDMVVQSVDRQSSLQAEPLTQKLSSRSRRLLALHAKITRILYETRAGAFIDGLLLDNVHAEDLAGDGGTHVGLLMQLRLDGWCPARMKRRTRNCRGQKSETRGGLDELDTTTTFWIEEAQLVHEEEHQQSPV